MTGRPTRRLGPIPIPIPPENEGGIRATATYQGAYADLLAKYTAPLRSKSAPTIMLAGDIATGHVTDVKAEHPGRCHGGGEPEDVKLDDLSAAARNYYAVDGKQQAVPMNVSTYAEDEQHLLKQAGITDTSSLRTTTDAPLRLHTLVRPWRPFVTTKFGCG